MRNVAQGIPSEIPFTTEALRVTPARIRDEWDNYQASRDRAIFQLIEWWAHERRANEYAQQALRLQRPQAPKISDPFAAIIFCTSDREKADFKTRSKWSRVLRYAKVFKDPDESLQDFAKARGGINKCARRYARRLGRAG
jgi:hypothetical protein